VDRLDCIRIFQKVADHKSFIGAARELRISAVAASRAVATLEEELCVRLLRRTTRSVRLTEQGMEYLERTRRALSELEDAARAARGEDASPQGELVVTAPVMFGRLHIVPIISRLLSDHPQLSVKLTLVDRVVRLVEEDIDVAVRIAHLPDSSLRAVPLATVRKIFIASPKYLAQRGTPKSVEELASHDLIVFDSAGLKADSGRTSSRSPMKPRFVTNSVEATVNPACL